jgi:hypothetical protein
MFFDKQPKNNQEEYIELLRMIGSLSRLFSVNTSPFLHYRVAENLFCMCLKAKNLSRSDCTADASKDRLGFGIKTFLDKKSGYTYEKIAEFNKKRSEFAYLSNEKLIMEVVKFRNERINITKRLHGLDEMIYHYTVRGMNKISIAECNLDFIDDNRIRIGKKTDNIIYFEDGIGEYHFSLAKNTLYKRFDMHDFLEEIPVEIIDNPYELLREWLSAKWEKILFAPIREEPHVFLPLYSLQGKRHVAEKSGLNQWNAGGRARHPDEVYIPIPQKIHRLVPGFFPGRDVPFELELPYGEVISAKVCQDNNKALMSNPNEKLGRWLLRDVLRLREGELVTIEMLDAVGIDSAVVYKIDEGKYTIDFTPTGSFDDFIGGVNIEE